MFTNEWNSLPDKRRRRFEMSLRDNARKFFSAKQRSASIYAIVFFYMSKFVIKKYIGADGYPYRYWNERGWFKKRPF
jgi:hypothetical protein